MSISKSKNWKPLIGKAITNTQIDWGWVKESGLFKKKIYYPQSIVLSLEGGGLVIISALEVQDGTHFGMAKKLPRYPIPVFLLAQLAVHKEFHGGGLGKKQSISYSLRACS